MQPCEYLRASLWRILRWKTLLKHWRKYNECNATTSTGGIKIDAVFAHRSEDDKIYPLMTDAQWADVTYKHLFKRNSVVDQGLEIKLIGTHYVSAKMVD